jgi:FMN phosphatase YigB (HAD superfamily)
VIMIRNVMNDKIIVVDCDGVLLDWEHSFKLWMKEKGYEVKNDVEYSMAKSYEMEKPEMKKLIRHFNESATMCCLPPLRDAVKYVRKIHEELGYVFHCVTSMTLDRHANKLREQNLSNLFGETAFEKVQCLDTGADKDDALLPYLDSGCIWVEDKIKNAELGDRLGMSAVLMKHDHQNDYTNDAIPAVESWKEIYEMLS